MLLVKKTMKTIYYFILLIFITYNSCTLPRHPKGYWINIGMEKTSNQLVKKKGDLQPHLIRIKGNKYKIFRQNSRNSISRFMAKNIYQKIKFYKKDSLVLLDNNYLKFYRRLNDSLKVKSSEKIILDNKRFTMKKNNSVDTLNFFNKCRLEYTTFGKSYLTRYERIREKGFDIILIDKPLKTFVIRNEFNDKIQLTTISRKNENIEFKKIL